MVFNYLALDKDKSLTFDEFNNLEQNNRRKLFGIRNPKDQAKLGDKMNLTKAMIMISNKLEERYPNLKTAFKVFDSDGDG